MVAPRWLADEMVGRLARYLRFLGHDTRYARGLSDGEIVLLARSEHRILLTRDRDLAGRVPEALFLKSSNLADQFRAVVRAFPDAGYQVRFDRCSLCNGLLNPVGNPELTTVSVPDHTSLRAAVGRAYYLCSDCGHRYWEGSHTADVRARVAQWLEHDR